MSRSFELSVRWRTSSKSIILRWPPERPAVNSPAIVPPILMAGLYEAFFAPPSTVFFAYRSQYGRRDGSKLGILRTWMYGRTVWY